MGTRGESRSRSMCEMQGCQDEVEISPLSESAAQRNIEPRMQHELCFCMRFPCAMIYISHCIV